MQPGDLSIILPEIILSVFAMIALLVGAYGGKDKLAPMMVWATVTLFVATLFPASRCSGAFLIGTRCG